MHFTVYSYHTGGMYAIEADRMKRSMRLVGIDDWLIEQVDDAGDWYRNTAQKAARLLEARRRIRGPLLYVDADAVFRRMPTAWDTRPLCEGDVWLRRWPRGGVLTGTIWINDTKGADDWLVAWSAVVDSRMARGQVRGHGQDVLNHGLVVGVKTLADLTLPLPGRWCWVFDEHEWAGHTPPADIIVEHLQASRHGCAGDHSDVQRGRRERRVREVDQWLT